MASPRLASTMLFEILSLHRYEITIGRQFRKDLTQISAEYYLFGSYELDENLFFSDEEIQFGKLFRRVHYGK